MSSLRSRSDSVSRYALALVIVIGGCVGSTPVSPAPAREVGPAENRVKPNAKAELFQAAEQALIDESRLDYELPFTKSAPPPSRATSLFLQACKAGHHAACWNALALVDSADQREITTLIETHCLGGDDLSCRALPTSGERRFPDSPGAIGRSEACEDHESSACDRVGLRAECKHGFSHSCVTLLLMSPPEADRDQLLTRSWELTREGCEAGILRDCDRLSNHDGDPKRSRANERTCSLVRDCLLTARDLLAAGQVIPAREMYERSCQYSRSAEIACEELMLLYLEKKLAEPVPGRGQAFADSICARAVKLAPKILRKGEKIEDRVRACKYSKIR
jgi:hypothetical protein